LPAIAGFSQRATISAYDTNTCTHARMYTHMHTYTHTNTHTHTHTHKYSYLCSCEFWLAFSPTCKNTGFIRTEPNMMIVWHRFPTARTCTGRIVCSKTKLQQGYTGFGRTLVDMLGLNDVVKSQASVCRLRTNGCGVILGLIILTGHINTGHPNSLQLDRHCGSQSEKWGLCGTAMRCVLSKRYELTRVSFGWSGAGVCHCPPTCCKA
jgi:hypothetical protein